MVIEKGTVNVIQLSISFMLLFFAYMSQEFIQEPLIESESKHRGTIDIHAGYNSLAILYFFFTLSCLVVSPIIERISAKWSIAVGMIAYIIFQAGFLQINTYYLYGSSVVLGIGASFLWIGQGKYLTENCNGNTIERNTSMMWCILKISLLGGGIFLFYMFQNQTISDVIENDKTKYFCLIFITISVIAMINVMCLRPSEYIPTNKKEETLSETLMATFKLMGTYQMCLLAVIFIYTGFSRSFWISIYPTSIKFTSKLGGNTTKIMAIACIATGVGQVAAGLLLTIIGNHAKKIGKDVILVIACIIHLIVFGFIYVYFPYDASLHQTENVGILPPNVYVANLCSLFLGIGDAIIQTQVYAYLCDGYSSESSHAFALFKFYSGVSSTLAFFVSQYFTLPMHLILYGSFAFLSGISAVIAQRVYFHKIQHFHQGSSPIVGDVPNKIHLESTNVH